MSSFFLSERRCIRQYGQDQPVWPMPMHPACYKGYILYTDILSCGWKRLQHIFQIIPTELVVIYQRGTGQICYSTVGIQFLNWLPETVRRTVSFRFSNQFYINSWGRTFLICACRAAFHREFRFPHRTEGFRSGTNPPFHPDWERRYHCRDCSGAL